MMNGVTKSGFAYEITDERADNYEVVKTLRAWIGGDVFALFALPRLLLGPEGEMALEEHCRGENGVISKNAMIREIREILETKPVKN